MMTGITQTAALAAFVRLLRKPTCDLSNSDTVLSSCWQVHVV